MNKKKELTTSQLEDARRLKALYESRKKELGITQQQIADTLNISQGGVGHYLNGRNPLNVQVASIFSHLLKAPIQSFSPSLAKEAELITTALKGNVTDPAPYKPAPKFPVISFVQAGNWVEACEPYTLSEIDEWYESEVTVHGSAFWLKVKGDSMTAPTGVSIPEGSLVLVDTGRDPVNGSFVIAKLTDANEATFKKLVIDGAKYLKALNPAYPAITVNGNCKIIGVVVQMMMRFV